MGLPCRILALRETLCLHTNRPTLQTCSKQHSLDMTRLLHAVFNSLESLLLWLMEVAWLAVKPNFYPWIQTNTKLTPNRPRGHAAQQQLDFMCVLCNTNDVYSTYEVASWHRLGSTVDEAGSSAYGSGAVHATAEIPLMSLVLQEMEAAGCTETHPS